MKENNNHKFMINPITIGLVVTLSILLVSMGAGASNGSPYMPMSGKFSVDAKGAANYKMKIEVVPAKMKPNITLSYNSQGGGSYVGAGWSMGGAAAIRMCSLNKRQDNKWSNISLNMGADDYSVNRFCIGGSRLSVIEGSYGADGSKYQTELLGKRQITAVGKCGDGPCSFEVKLSTGQVDIYGGDANTTVQLDNKDILVWGVSSKTDRYGNTIKYTYEDSDATNVLYPKEIDYFFSADKNKSRKVLFNYMPMTQTNRQVKRIGLGGYSFKPDKMLSEISTHDDDDKGVLVYKLSYQYDAFSDKYGLTSLSKSSYDGSTQYFDHTFSYKDYQPTTAEFNLVNTVTMEGTPVDWDGVKIVIMDKYGDGYKGVGVIRNEGNSAIFSFSRGDENGKLTVASDRMDLGKYSPTDKSSDSYSFLSFDKNGDGINDLIKIYKGVDGRAYAQSYLSIAGKPNFTVDPIIQSLASTYIDTGKMRISYVGRDINGDGLHDIIAMAPNTDQEGSTYNITVFYADVKGGFPTHESINGQIENSVVPKVDQSINFSDYDKDTLSDFFLVKKSQGLTQATPLYNRQGKFLAPDGNKSKFIDLGDVGSWKDLPAYKFIDFNTDGLIDLVKFNYKEPYTVTGNVYMNTGNLFGDMLNGSGIGDNTTQVFNFTEPGEDHEAAHDAVFVDINGDGQPDIMKYRGGAGDPKDPNLTYFDTYLHTGNTYVKGRSTSPFGAHTRNIISTLGDNPISGILSVKQTPNQLLVSFYANRVKRPRPEITSIDNGAGLVYSINYAKVSPFIDYANIKQPDYPNILLSKVRLVVSDYSRNDDKGKDHGSSIKHAYKYMFPIYNKHDWMFSGYSRVEESMVGVDKLFTRNYSTTYPTRGKLLSTKISQLSTGVPFSMKSKTYDFVERYPKANPKVVLVYTDTITSTTYQDSTTINPDVAFSSVIKMGFDKVWGIQKWQSSSYEGSKEALYKCYRYTINTTGKETYTIGDRTGVLYTSVQDNCNTFAGHKDYDAPFTHGTGDYDLLFTKYSDDGLFNPLTNLVYSSENKAYTAITSVFNKIGQVTKTTGSTNYTPLSGKFDENGTALVTTFEFDEAGYIKKKTVNGLESSNTTDSRFGKLLTKTKPNGDVTSNVLNALGTVVSTAQNGVTLSKTSYDSDADGRFKQVDTTVSKGVATVKTYIGADSKAWKHTIKTNDSDIVTAGELAVNPATGKVVSRFAPYFKKPSAKAVKISYDIRGNKSKEVRDSWVKEFQHLFGNSQVSVITKGNDPSHTSKTPVVLKTSIHNPVTRVNTHLTPLKTQSVATLDIIGNVINIVDYRGLVSTKTFDVNRKLVSNTTPDSGTELFNWSASGKLLKHTANDVINEYKYDVQDRVVSRTRTQGKFVRDILYTWGDSVTGFFNKGLITSITDGAVSTSLNYDINSNIVNKGWTTNNGKNVFTYGYLPGGFPLDVTYPDGSVVSYTYNKSGEINSFQYKDSGTGAVDPEKSVRFSEFGIDSKPGTINLGSKVTLVNTVDGWGRSISSTATNEAKDINYILYTWDDTGNIISQTRGTDVTSYTYDVLERLVRSKNARRDLFYKYDENSNLLQNGANTFVMQPASNRLATGLVGGKKITFKYDKEGRLLGDGIETYTYGDSGRLELIDNPSGKTNISYFNGKKFTDNVSTYLDNGFEMSKAGNVKRLKAFGQPFLVISPSSADYIIPDRLNSHMMTIDTGTVEPSGSFEYEPYGASHEIK